MAKTIGKTAAKAALEATTLAIQKLKQNTAKNFWTIGRRLNAISELGVHQIAGYDKIEDYTTSVLEIGRFAAFQYMRIASSFGQSIAALYGPEKLDRALRYIAATPEDEKPSDIPTLPIRVP